MNVSRLMVRAGKPHAAGLLTSFVLSIAFVLAVSSTAFALPSDINITGSTFVAGNLSLTGSIIQNINTTPRIVGNVSDNTRLASARGVFVSGKYAFATSLSNDSISILDISNPSSPVILSSLSDVRMDGAFKVFVSGKYAYVVGNSNDSLTIVDISNITLPTITGSVTDVRLDAALDVYVSGKYAYVTGNSNDSLTVVDISNPSSPSISGSVTNVKLDGARNLFVSGKYAYVASQNNNSLTIVDISNPAAPSITGHITSESKLNGSTGVYVSGMYAYVTSFNNNSLTIVNITNSSSPSILSSLTDVRLLGAGAVEVARKYAYVSSILNYNSLNIIDVSNPSSPSIVATLTDARLNTSHDIQVVGRYIYVPSQNNNSISIIELPGIDSPVASIGSLQSNLLYVTENAQVTNDLYVGNGIVAGAGGLYSQGPISIYGNGNVSLAVVTGSAIVGHTAPLGRLGESFEVTTSANYGGVALNTFSSTAAEAPIIDFRHSKSSTKGTQSVVASGDALGYIVFGGSDGTNFQNAAVIKSFVDGTPGAGDMPGRLSFWTTLDGSAAESERMRIDNAGNVGIGTTNPIACAGCTALALHIQGDNPSIRLNDTSGTNSDYLITTNSGNFMIGDNVAGGLIRLLIDSSGKVGIGTTAPSINLHVNGSANGTVGEYIVNSNGGTAARSILLLGTPEAANSNYGFFEHLGDNYITDGIRVANSTTLGGWDTGGLNVIANGAVPIRFATNGYATADMVISSSGFVGINTTTPTSTLSVAGNINVTGSGTTGNIFVSNFINFTGGGYMYDNGTAVIIGHI